MLWTLLIYDTGKKNRGASIRDVDRHWQLQLRVVVKVRFYY